MTIVHIDDEVSVPSDEREEIFWLLLSNLHSICTSNLFQSKLLVRTWKKESSDKSLRTEI
uniref:Uncharacterized protein n=1 Tax=Parascaris equorum TaxID=6256 RepID=A0A914S5D3_PAREQ